MDSKRQIEVFPGLFIDVLNNPDAESGHITLMLSDSGGGLAAYVAKPRVAWLSAYANARIEHKTGLLSASEGLHD